MGISDAGRTAPAAARALCEKGIFMVESIQAACRTLDGLEAPVFAPPSSRARHWLSLWPLETIPDWGLSGDRQLRVYRCAVQALLQSQSGQALEEAKPVDALPQDKIPEACLGAMELGAGALMQLAARLGAILGGADAALEQTLADFGKSFGVAFQMFQDINAPSTVLASRRPGWVWAVAAQYSSAEDFAAFRGAIQLLPHPQAVDQWLHQQALHVRAKSLAIDYLNGAFDPLEDRLGATQSNVWVRELALKLRQAVAS
ncbi:polyprenyl synthetase family protein [bacterium]|nr:polyprenyl synthetase family protein [bacterium]